MNLRQAAIANIRVKYQNKRHLTSDIWKLVFTLVKFSEFSPARACSFCQQTSYPNLPDLCKMQSFDFFTASPLEIRVCCIRRKFADYDLRIQYIIQKSE